MRFPKMKASIFGINESICELINVDFKQDRMQLNV
jgi:hypothetical protein